MASKTDDATRPRASADAEWARHRERGSMTMLRIMTFLSLRLGRSGGRVFLYLIAAYFFTFAPTARRHARAYLRRALGREPTAGDRFRHVLTFATTIHDRVYLLKERFDLFDVSVDGEDVVREAMLAGNGAFLVGSHVGSFEIIRTIGRRQPGLQVAMAMYEDNARKVNEMLAAINPAAKPDVIALGHLDAMLKIQEYLSRGTFVGVLGDRTLGNEASQQVNFLGQPARFPVGAMRAAAIMRRPVIFMIGLYRGGNRYHVAFESLADFSLVEEPRQRAAAVRAAIERYAAVLEKYVRSDPYNWFNFFDFWRGGMRGVADKLLGLGALALLLGMSCAFAADSDLDRVMGALAQRKHGHVWFTEKKFISMLDRPVESSGELLYDAPDRLEKKTLKPKPESLVLEGGAVSAQRGRRHYVLDLKQYPQVLPFIESIRATLAGDRAALERVFAVSFVGTFEQWTLGLAPLDSQLHETVKEIHIEGAKDLIHSVEIQEADGDRSLLTIGPDVAP